MSEFDEFLKKNEIQKNKNIEYLNNVNKHFNDLKQYKLYLENNNKIETEDYKNILEQLNIYHQIKQQTKQRIEENINNEKRILMLIDMKNISLNNVNNVNNVKNKRKL